MPTKFERLQSLLAELFQLDQADLDFGIYRIMNLRRGEIIRFLSQELLPQVRTALAGQGAAGRGELEAELRRAEQQLQALGVDPGTAPKVQELRERLAAYGADPAALEDEVYSHLYDFFRRYYDEGDFISMRRYKEGVYAIPYEGEEVKLHWANADQYYVKTAENFRDYAFRLPSGRRVHFKLAEAETDRDNVKAAEGKDRRFVLGPGDAMSVAGDELIIRFEYRADPEKRKQAELSGLAAATILTAAPEDWRTELAKAMPTEAAPRRTLLDKQLADYTARNTFDYFIHKDLRGFLRRELDFYIKNEVVRLDDIEEETAPRVEAYLGKVRALRQVAHKIIDFLAQTEELQKRLWLKKKFVVETNYCVTLDRVPEELYAEIAANDAQRAEWVRLFAIDEIAESTVTPGYTLPLTVAFLRANPFLVLDTKFFDGRFRDRLVGSFDDLDEQTDGLLVHSENFQALQLLGARYSGQVKCIYIDPPYNATATEILYKNDYKHSSWLALLADRLRLSSSFLANTGILCVTIDDYEVQRLRFLLGTLMGDTNYLATVAIRNNPSGRSTVKGFAINHEYALFFAKAIEDAVVGRLPHSEEQASRYDERSENGRQFEWENFRKNSSGSQRTDRPKQYFPIYYDRTQKALRIPALQWQESSRSWLVLEDPRQAEVVLWPKDAAQRERVWRYGVDRATTDISELMVKQVDGKFEVYKRKYLREEGSLPRTWWDDPAYSARDNGTRALVELFGPQKPFEFPKSVEAVRDCLRVSSAGTDALVLDYFAGSATTGHAVVELNRNDDAGRKYLLVEMGEHFDTAVKPRIQKVVYSKDWRDGKPVSREGSSHLFKYLRLESYEDALNNLAFRQPAGAQLALAGSDAFREDYTLHYMLDAESRASLLNVRVFENPFGYTLEVATGIVGETRPVAADLVETFNYLLGLRVRHVDAIQGYRVVQGLNPQGERVLVIWRNLKEKSNADLEVFFRKQDYNPRDMEFDLIYVNGDNHLENLRRPDETWKVRLIEEEFMRLMFDVQDV
ncbi:MAG: DNA methyltransferase [Chloroflexi bacterium]|nr:DNA methyltransferase [Chloroflexota bacterium]